MKKFIWGIILLLTLQVHAQNMFVSYYSAPPATEDEFSPLDIDSCVLWLKADAGVTLNGSTVSQWDDQSGNGNHAVQATASYQPTFVANQLNGKPVLRFDGSNDFMEFTAGLLGGFNEIAIIAVWKIKYKSNGGIFGTSGYVQLEILTSNGEVSTLRVGVDNQMIGKEIVLNGWFDNNSYNTSISSLSASAFDLRRNSNNVAPQVGAMAMFPLKSNIVYNLGRYAWGVGNFYTEMDCAEFIIYNRKINNSEILQIEQYLQNKYAHY